MGGFGPRASYPPTVTRRLVPVCLALALAACATTTPPDTPGRGTGTGTVDVQVLAFNDFHGHLDPPTGSNGRIGGIDAGGIEYLATHIARLEATNPHTVVVSAGDNIGATPLISGMFHDEPAIEALGAIGLDVSTVGNHEFDEGWRELVRMQRGGCHPADGCQDGTPFTGASFEFLSANVRTSARGDTLFPATAVTRFDGVAVGFIGLALEGTPSVVTPTGVAGLTFLPEADAANEAARELRRRGVNAIVVLIHQGDGPGSNGPDACGNQRGGIMPVLSRMTDDIDVVVSGHTHRSYVCRVGAKLVTSAESFGRLVTDIDLSIDRATGRVVSKTARNVVVTRDVEKAPALTAIIERYRPFEREIGGRAVGTISASLERTTNAAGESSLGDVVADSLLDATRDSANGGAQVAFMNPGGLRSDLVHSGGSAGGQPSRVTYSDAFTLLPFGNVVLVKTMTGEAIAQLLEQQFDNPAEGRRTILQVSQGFAYAYDASRPHGQRVSRASMTLDGRPISPSDSYRVVMSEFLWAGGDGFTKASAGTNAVAQGLDLDAFLGYLARHSPIGPGPQNRIRIER